MSIKVITGDCREVFRTLPDESVHCVVTSPPYWGLRDYGTATWEGGDSACSHTKGRPGSDRADGIVAMVSHRNRDGAGAFSGDCHCGARRIDSQIGLEPDFNAYIAEMVAVFREVRRVLRSDGTLWLNLGDSYAAQGGGKTPGLYVDKRADGATWQAPRTPTNGLKPKDLCGIPWRVAFALQADGWWLRQDIIWSKPNPMPESVTDRCTKAHEYIFLLSKSARYYYDAEAVAETAVYAGDNRGERTDNRRGTECNSVSGITGATRNKRSVWEVSTAPFSEAHFATFPPALIEPCIKAGCPKGGTVLDPFGGAGTTGLVADRLQRNSILIELNPEYAKMANRRVMDDAPLFVEAAE